MKSYRRNIGKGTSAGNARAGKLHSKRLHGVYEEGINDIVGSEIQVDFYVLVDDKEKRTSAMKNRNSIYLMLTGTNGSHFLM